MNDMKKNNNALLKTISRSLIVIAIAALLVAIPEIQMRAFLSAELAAVEEASRRAGEAAAAAKAEDTPYSRRMLEIAKLEAQEAFYQKYKYRNEFHYYGQFYEMYQQVYKADTIFIGTSHASHGVNPKYIEKAYSGKGNRSFFNFSLNGSNPSYYVEWYKFFKDSGYPTPRTIVYCVDWFMTDLGWLWRRKEFDSNYDCPQYIAKQLKIAEEKAIAEALKSPEETEAPAETETAAETEAVLDTGEEKAWFTLEDFLTKFMNSMMIIHNRDRIPEMVGSWFDIAGEDSEGETTVAETAEEELPPLPVYKHNEGIVDGTGILTDSYYKGYITWEAYFDGGTRSQNYNEHPGEWEAFVRLVEQFQKDGIEVIMIQVPEYVPGRRVPGKRDIEANERLEDFAWEHDIPFINYNAEESELNSNPDYFSDWGHMNEIGSTNFSKILIKDLEKVWKD